MDIKDVLLIGGGIASLIAIVTVLIILKNYIKKRMKTVRGMRCLVLNRAFMLTGETLIVLA